MAHSGRENHEEQAREQISHLRAALERAASARAAGRHEAALRSAYEVVERALKAALLYVGVPPPPWINVGPQLEENEARFSPEFRANLEVAVYAARVSWEGREPWDAAQGGADPEEESNYDEYDSESALETAARILEMVEQLVQRS